MPTDPRPVRGSTPGPEVYLNLWRTYDASALEDELFAGYDLTAQQYNVLRLLKTPGRTASRPWPSAVWLVSEPRTSPR